MGRMEKMLLSGILLLLAAVLLLMFFQSSAADNASRTYNVSVLVRAPSERFRKGLEQAALDYNVDLHMVSGYEQNSGAQQAEYLQRELRNDVDAVVIQAEDTEDMTSALDTLRPRVPVISVERRLDNDARVTLHVGVDDGDLGSRLGELIAGEAGERTCLIFISRGDKPYILQRRKGLELSLAAKGIPYETLYYEGDTQQPIREMLMGREPAVVAVLGEDMLLTLCEEIRPEDILFGAGYVGGARTYLENGRIAGLVVYSEFDAGYLSIREAVRAADGEVNKDVPLELYLANATNMYKAPLEQILFPIG